MLHKLNPFIRYAKVISFSCNALEMSIAFDNRMFVCLDGAMSVAADTEYALVSGDAIFIPQYTPYRLFDLNCRIISFNFDLTADHSDRYESLRTHPLADWDGGKLFCDISLPFLDSVRKFHSSEMKQTFIRAAEAFGGGEPYSRELASTYLKRGIIGMISSPKPQRHTAVERFTEAVERYYDKDITAAGIAELIGYHEVYLNRLVKAQLGTTVSEYIVSFRISQAKKLLDIGHTVTEAATMCGFSELSYFSRCFKKREGITPREYGRFTGLL